MDPTIVPSMSNINQRVMTRDGRVSDQNLYGNLTGTHNRIANSVGSNKPSIVEDYAKQTSSHIELTTSSNNLRSDLQSDTGRGSLVTTTVVIP